MQHHIQTYSGRLIDAFNPTVQDIALEDIFIGLSRHPRFNGMTKHRMVSVLEHSMLVSDILRITGASLTDQLWGLMHDASEAVLSDIPSPIKCHPSFAFYRELEAKWMDVIAQSCGLTGEMPESVHVADKIALAVEAEHFIDVATSPAYWRLVEIPQAVRDFLPPLSVTDTYCTVPDAIDRFLELYNMIEHIQLLKKPLRYIVLEGSDGAGTTTHTKKLAEQLGSLALKQPTNKGAGAHARTLFTHGQPSDHLLALLFAADRYEHGQELVEHFKQDQSVVFDRGYLSTLVYQQSVDRSLLEGMNKHREKEDLVIFIDVSLEEKQRRISQRLADGSAVADMFDARQVELDRAYKDEVKSYSDSLICVVDGNGSIDDVFDRIMRVLT
jgi:uncharacterized protein